MTTQVDVHAVVTPDANGCWIWGKTTRPDGYGVNWVDGRLVRAHRWVYEQQVGPIPEGMVLDHLCRVPACVNPDHLEPVTQRENVRRGVSPPAQRAQRTHCVNGHELAGEHLYIHPTRGTRNCRTCMIENAAARRRGERGTGTCEADKCERSATCRGLCPTHYDRMRRPR